MAALLERIDRIFVAGVAAAMTVIMVTVIADVLGRYLLNAGFIFANELSRLGFVWMTFLVMPLAVSRGLHVAITSVVDSLPQEARPWVFRLAVLLGGGFMLVVMIGAWISIGSRAAEPMNTLPITAQWFFWPLLIGAGWSLVHLLHQLFTGRPPIRDLTEQLRDMA